MGRLNTGILLATAAMFGTMAASVNADDRACRCRSTTTGSSRNRSTNVDVATPATAAASRTVAPRANAPYAGHNTDHGNLVAVLLLEVL